MSTPAQELEKVRFARYEFRLKAEDTLDLPAYKGSTLRGAFGHAFRSVTCSVKREDCDGCMLRTKCAYSYVFFTPPPPSATMMRKYPYAPHPFIIEPPSDPKQTYAPGEILSFGLVLVGKGADYLPYFVFAFCELGKRGLGRGNKRFSLQSVHHCSPHGTRQIFSATENILEEPKSYMSLSDLSHSGLSASEVQIQYLTPTRVIDEGHLSDEIEFSLLIRALLRRISTLAYFHCGTELDLDYKGLIARAEAVKTSSSSLIWHDWERYSTRQKAKLKMGGVLGEATYTGPVQEFYPLLLLGEHLHVGKGTSMGLGKYQIVRT